VPRRLGNHGVWFLGSTSSDTLSHTLSVGLRASLHPEDVSHRSKSPKCGTKSVADMSKLMTTQV